MASLTTSVANAQVQAIDMQPVITDQEGLDVYHQSSSVLAFARKAFAHRDHTTQLASQAKSIKAALVVVGEQLQDTSNSIAKESVRLDSMSGKLQGVLEKALPSARSAKFKTSTVLAGYDAKLRALQNDAQRLFNMMNEVSPKLASAIERNKANMTELESRVNALAMSVGKHRGMSEGDVRDLEGQMMASPDGIEALMNDYADSLGIEKEVPKASESMLGRVMGYIRSKL